MKYTLMVIGVVISLSAIFAVSCKQNNNNTSPVTTSLNDLFSDLKPTPQTFTVTAGIKQTVIGSDSTVIIFYPYSFKDNNGNIITSGTVNISLIEVYRPGDMITNRTSATSGGQLLESGGQVNITATMNGKPIIANNFGIAFKAKSYSSTQMELFYGTGGQGDSSTSWNMSDTSKKGTTNNTNANDSSRSNTPSWPNFYYLFDSCTNFNWINCDHFFYGNSNITTTITITYPDNGFNYSNTQLFIVFPGLNSCMELPNSIINGLETISNFRIPKNGNLDFVIISKINSQYYYFQQTNVAPASTIKFNATMTQDSRGDVVSRLEGL